MYSSISQAFNNFTQPSYIPSAPGRMDLVFCNNESTIKLRKYFIDQIVFLNCYISSAVTKDTPCMKVCFSRLIKNKNDISSILKYYYNADLVKIYTELHQEQLNLIVKMVNATVNRQSQQTFIHQDLMYGNAREMARILMQMNKRYYSQRKVEQSLRKFVEQTRILAERKVNNDPVGTVKAMDQSIDTFNLFSDILGQGIVRYREDQSNNIK